MPGMDAAGGRAALRRVGGGGGAAPASVGASPAAAAAAPAADAPPSVGVLARARAAGGVPVASGHFARVACVPVLMPLADMVAARAAGAQPEGIDRARPEVSGGRRAADCTAVV